MPSQTPTDIQIQDPTAPKIIAIMGSYRDQGVVSQLTDAVMQAAEEAGAEVETIRLKDQHIEFCTNCRECMQTPGETRGQCPHDDDMNQILERVEAADAVVLAAPVNMWNINALTRQFMERCAGFGYWPWGQHAPTLRKKSTDKKAVLIAASGAPAFAAQWLTGAVSALKWLAKILGAKPIGTLWQGKINEHIITIDPKTLEKAQRLGRELASKQ